MDEKLYSETEAVDIGKSEQGAIISSTACIKTLNEVSLKLIVNGEEFVSLLCINQYPEELAIGFLYNEGIIDSYEDITSLQFNERLFAVVIQLRAGLTLDTQASLRSITSGCGKGLTYINPLKMEKFQEATSDQRKPISMIFDTMKQFNKRSEIYTTIGGVHSVLFVHDSVTILNEDIGRHNCVDKITGILLREHTVNLASAGVLFSSGRISSEIMTKLVRLGVPILVSRSSPTASAVKLAETYNITLLGYVRGSKATIYTHPERILLE